MKPKFSPVRITSLASGSVRTEPADSSGLGSADYRRYMKSPEWAARKRGYFLNHARRCKACGSKSDIQLHHMNYARLGRERDSDMVALCERCHTRVHQLHARAGGSLKRVTLNFISSKSKNPRGKPGERRHRPCAPSKEKPAFIPRNRRGATTDSLGRIVSADRGDDLPTWIAASGVV